MRGGLLLPSGLILACLLCCGCGARSDNAKAAGNVSTSELLQTAQTRLDSDDNQQARSLAEQALQNSASEAERQEAQAVLDEAAARQNFLNRRVEELTRQADAAVADGNFDEARRLAERALQIEMATNHQLAKLAVSRIDEAERNKPVPQDLSWADVVTNAKPGVVVIASEFAEGVGTGTGFIVGDGLVVTNHHVISNPETGELASRVLVKDADGNTSLSPGLLYRQASKDIAIIKMGHGEKDAHSLTLFRGELRQGDEVAALGHPKGFEFTFSMGYISAVRDAASFSERFAGKWVQHSAPISRGNSGGPLLNRQAEVIAMNSWYHDEGSDQNLNFAIAASEIDAALRDSSNRSLQPFRERLQSSPQRALREALEEFLTP